MGDASNAKTYVKWYFVYLWVISKKKFNKKLLTCSEALKEALKDLKKPSKVPKKESADEKADRTLGLVTCKLKSSEAYAKQASTIGVCYDLFRQLLADKHQVQWDPIIREVHEKDPWTGLDGSKHKGLRLKTSKLLDDCIMFHKLTVFNCDVADLSRFVDRADRQSY